MKKETFQWITWILVAIVSLAIAIPSVILIYNNLNQDQNTTYNVNKKFSYDEYMQNFSLSTMNDSQTENNSQEVNKYLEIDKKMNEFYLNNTAPLILEAQLGTKLSIVEGTMWRYDNNELRDLFKYNPNKYDPNRTYFATNIHVVAPSLFWADETREINVGPFYDKGIQRQYKFFCRKVDKNNTSQPFGIGITRSDQISVLNDVRVEKISLSKNYSKYFDQVSPEQSKDLIYYSDFIILSTSTPTNQIFPESNPAPINFVDTEKEFNDALNSLLKMREPLYIAGFPSISNHDNFSYDCMYKYVTIRYMQEKSQSYVYTSTAIQQLGKDNFFNSRNGLNIFNNIIGEFHSYANQLIIPKLHIGPGSSGSLVCIYQDGEIKPLGIWWGEYSSQIQSVGSIDFFYSTSYSLYKNQKVPGYNNLINAKTTVK